jgi:ATP-dependent RNA helicase RhlE
MSEFNKLNLNNDLLKAIKAKGYTSPTPIQAEAVPPLLKGKDLLGIAQTGTGKTAAFAWPIINKLAKDKTKTKPKNCRALILTPTRELASQICENFRTYSKGMGIFSGVIFGGVGKQGQITMMKKGCDVLIATPGRLVDLMSEGFITFDQLEIFVLDEADRMLDMGFIHDIKKVIALLPKKRQTMLFSATMPSSISGLAKSLLDNPTRVEVTPENTTVEKIDQTVLMVEKKNKMHLLKETLSDTTIKSALVFSLTKHGADRIVRELLKSEISAVAIHGNKAQGARERALKDFKAGKCKVLVATDIAARGIDIDRVTHVINYNLPEDAESYVHRIGRTARAGRDGVSVSFCEATEVKLLKNVEKFIKYKIPVNTDHDFHVVHTKEEIAAQEKLKKEAKAKHLADRQKLRTKKRNSQNARSGSIRTKKAPSKNTKKKVTKKKRGSRR